MKIALFGATGFTGVSVLKLALEAGHEVKALVRNPAKVTMEHERLTLVKGDALSKDDIERLLDGTDVVLHCLGVGGKGNGKPTTLVSDSVRLVTEVMEARAMRRLVCMSNVGAGGSGKWWVNKLVVPAFLRWLQPLIDDKDRMEAQLRQTDLEWVALRLPNIVEGPAKPVKTCPDGKRISLSITTDSVAQYMLELAQASAIADPTVSVSN